MRRRMWNDDGSGGHYQQQQPQNAYTSPPPPMQQHSSYMQRAAPTPLMSAGQSSQFGGVQQQQQQQQSQQSQMGYWSASDPAQMAAAGLQQQQQQMRGVGVGPVAAAAAAAGLYRQPPPPTTQPAAAYQTAPPSAQQQQWEAQMQQWQTQQMQQPNQWTQQSMGMMNGGGGGMQSNGSMMSSSRGGMGGAQIGAGQMGGASMGGASMGGALMGGGSMGGVSMGGGSMGGVSMGGGSMGGASMNGVSSMGGASMGGMGGSSNYWNDQAYNMMGDTSGHSQQQQQTAHQSQYHHSQSNQYNGLQQMGGGGGRGNTWAEHQQQQQMQMQQQTQQWGNTSNGGGSYNQWSDASSKYGGSGREWNSGGGDERRGGRRGGGGGRSRDDHHDQWMNAGHESRQDDRMYGGSRSNNDHLQQQTSTMGSFGSWNPNEMPEEQPGADMMWRDPNPKQKKPPARDIGTSIWGDPNVPRSIALWTRPDNAPEDFDWTTEASVNAAMPPTGLGWDDPIPSDRTSREADIQKNITSPASAEDLVIVSNQLKSMVDRGILPVSVLASPLSSTALCELNDLLQCMTRLENLQMEKARMHPKTTEGLSAIDMSIHEEKLEMDRLRASICGTPLSRLNQWRKNESSVDQLLKATSQLTMNDNRGVSDWLESSPAPHESLCLEEEAEGDPKEFVPGKKWTWTDPNEIAQDPNITPGQMKQSPLVAIKTGDEVLRPIAPVDPMPQESGVWITFHHHGQTAHIYAVCHDLGKVIHFKIIDHQLYVKFASEVDAKHVSTVLVREFPAVSTSIRFISDNEMNTETTTNEVLQS